MIFRVIILPIGNDKFPAFVITTVGVVPATAEETTEVGTI